jgi:two-component system chemotaxis sensor kinase CheA
MDVVRRNVQVLHGQLEIRTEEGKGTTVAIRLPLTLAVLDGFLVRVGEEMFLLPLDAIQECLDATQVAQSGCTSLLDVRGQMVPAVRLGALFSYQSGGQSTAVLVRHNGATAALVVDELLGSYQAVIKPLGRMFHNVAGVSGSTILGDGRVALVLDVPGLFREALRAKPPATTN